jgi:hypothetical protein
MKRYITPEEIAAIINVSKEIIKQKNLSRCDMISNKYNKKVINLTYNNIDYIFKMVYIGKFNLFYYIKYFILKYPNKKMILWNMSYKVEGVSYSYGVININNLYSIMNRIFSANERISFN